MLAVNQCLWSSRSWYLWEFWVKPLNIYLLKCSFHCLFKITTYFSGIYLLWIYSRILSSVLSFNLTALFITLYFKVSRKYSGILGWLPKYFIDNFKMKFHNSTFAIRTIFFFYWNNNKSPFFQSRQKFAYCWMDMFTILGSEVSLGILKVIIFNYMMLELFCVFLWWSITSWVLLNYWYFNC